MAKKIYKNTDDIISPDFYGYFFDNAKDGIVVMDRQGRTVKINKRAAQISGLNPQDVIGKKFTELGILSPESLELAVKNFKIKMSGKKVLPYIVDIIGRNQLPKKFEVDYLLTGGSKQMDGEVIVLHEVTESQRLEGRIDSLNQALSLISKVNKLLIKIQNREELIDEICRLIVGGKNYSIAWIGFIKEVPEKYLGDIGFCGKNSQILNNYLSVYDSKDFNESLAGLAMKTGKTCLYNYSQKEKPSFEWQNIYTKLGIKSALAIPLRQNSRTIGVIIICSKKIESFIPEEVAIFEEMAGDLVYGLESIKIKSEKVLAEKLLQWQRDLIFNLNQCSNLSEAISGATKAILSLPELTSGGFYLINDQKNYLELINSFGLSKKFIKDVSVFELTSPQGKMVLAGQPIFVPYEKLIINKNDTRVKEGIKSIGVIPIIYKNEVIGCLNIASKKSYDISPSTKRFLEITSQIFGVIINRFKIEKRIVEEKTFSDQIISSVPGIFYVADAKGNFLRWNQNQLSLLSSNAQEMSGKNLFTDFALSTENAAKVQESLKQAMVSGESSVDFSYKSAQDEIRYFYLENKKIKIGKDDYLVGIGIDQTESRQMEKSLKEGIDRYNNITRNTTDFIFLKDNNRRYIFVNEAMEKLIGLPKEKILGKTPEEVFSPAVAAQVKISDDACFAGKKYDATVKIDISGSKYFLHTIQTPIFGLGGQIQGISGIVRDVTKEKMTEESLRESEERLNIIYENAPDAIFIYNFKGQFIDGNKSAEKLIGTKRLNVIGKNFLKMKLLPPDQLKLVSSIIAKNTLGQSTGPDQFLLNNFATKKIWLEISTYPIKIKGQKLGLAVARDISARKKTQEELAQTYLHYRSIFESSRDVMIEIDRLGKITQVSNIIENYGFKKSDLIGKKIFSLIGILGKEGVATTLKAHKERMSGKETSPHEIKIKSLDGREFIVEVRVNSLRDENNKIIGALAILTDATERKKIFDAVTETANRYQAIYNSTNNIIMQVDNLGKVVDVNKSIERYGYKQKDIIGVDIMEFSAKASQEDLGKIKEAFSQRLKGLQVPAYEIALPSKSGLFYSFEVFGNQINDSAGKPIGSILVLHDLTERKHSEEIVRAVASRYKMLFKASRDILIQIDLNHRILDINDKINFYGHRRSELIGKKIDQIEDVFSKIEIDKINSYIDSNLQNKDLKPTEINMKDYSGKIIPLEMISNSLQDHRGRNVGNLLIIHDISERKKRESEIKDKINELERLNLLMVGRELKMSELKEEIKRLKTKK